MSAGVSVVFRSSTSACPRAGSARASPPATTSAAARTPRHAVEDTRANDSPADEAIGLGAGNGTMPARWAVSPLFAVAFMSPFPVQVLVSVIVEGFEFTTAGTRRTRTGSSREWAVHPNPQRNTGPGRRTNSARQPAVPQKPPADGREFVRRTGKRLRAGSLTRVLPARLHPKSRYPPRAPTLANSATRLPSSASVQHSWTGFYSR